MEKLNAFLSDKMTFVLAMTIVISATYLAKAGPLPIDMWVTVVTGAGVGYIGKSVYGKAIMANPPTYDPAKGNTP